MFRHCHCITLCVTSLAVTVTTHAQQPTRQKIERVAVKPFDFQQADFTALLRGTRFKPSAAKFTFGNGQVAYRVIRERNYKESGRPLRVLGNVLRPNESLRVLSYQEDGLVDPKLGASLKVRPGLWWPVRIRLTGFEIRLYFKQEGRFSHMYRSVPKSIPLQVGRPVTVWQFIGMVRRPGEKEANYPASRDPSKEKLHALPPIQKGHQKVQRVTVQVMRMDATWNRFSKPVKDFLEKDHVKKILMNDR